jgi:hypothetical protein
MHLPLLFTPLGWVVLGAAGYLVYRAGKKAGEKSVGKEEKKVKAS